MYHCPVNCQWPPRVTGGHWSFLSRCSRRSECSRGRGSERWLWSFHPELGCLRVAALSPANISREERREVKTRAGGALLLTQAGKGACDSWGLVAAGACPQQAPVHGARSAARGLQWCSGLSWQVFLSVPDLPPLWPGESYSCHFGESQSPALLTNSGVMCPSPDPSEAPELPRGAGG